MPSCDSSFGRQLAAQCASAVAAALLLAPSAHSAAGVLQRGYDAGVSGATLGETILNTSNVAPTTFGLIFKLPVDDSIFAQPLFAPNRPIPSKGTHNVLYVATMSDSLYAFDADVGGAPLWSANFASRVGATPVPIADFVFSGNKNIVGNLGILSTPVIDAVKNIMYLVACTLENGTMVYRLHAVNIMNGTEPYGPGVVISGSYSVTVSGSPVTSTFDARYQLQRVSLVLVGDQVVIGFGPIELEYPGGYIGWMMTYNKTTLQQSGIFATVPVGSGGGGLWQSGRPPVVDSSGYVYVFVGNAYTNGYDGVNNFSESVLKLDPANGLKLVDWFTPGNWSYLDSKDLDLGSSGPLAVPGTNFIAGGGKTGYLYVLRRTDLGKFNANDTQVVQKEQITPIGMRGGPVYWQRSSENGGPLLYNWGSSDWVKSYPFNGKTFATTPSSQGSGSQIWPGGILSLSANADQQGTGILWATVATSGDAENDPPVPGELHAFDADNVSLELWNSAMNPSRDSFGNFAKFVPPVVVNGKVYVATWSSQLAVYGLIQPVFTVTPSPVSFGSQQINIASAPQTITLTNTGNVALPITNITLSGLQFSQTNNCGTTVPVKGTCVINVVFTPTFAGAHTSTLSVNLKGGGTQSVPLSGNGVVPTFTLLPTQLSFGTEQLNVASVPMPAVITNTGSGPLPIAGIAIQGLQYSQTNNCGASVPIKGSCTINVVFTPTFQGSHPSTLTVKVTGGGTQSVALSGVGGA